jgi:Ribbon-helix-helix protein, copG family
MAATNSPTTDLEKGHEAGVEGKASLPPPRRINVAINSEMLAAIDRVIEREQVTLTEAVRRLVAYGDFVYRAVKEDRASVILRKSNGEAEREVVLV